MSLFCVVTALTLPLPGEPLSSWHDTPVKRSIMTFIDSVTRPDSSDFVPASERIAVFDNDGCLWSEQPVYFQAIFIFDRIKELAPQHPEWIHTEPFASVLKGDWKTAMAGGERALVEMAMATHAGTTTEEFEKLVSDWMAAARHPATGRHFTEMVFQPMLDLLDHLRANGFKTFIVSGGGIEFMRPWAEKVYGVPQKTSSDPASKRRMKCATASRSCPGCQRLISLMTSPENLWAFSGISGGNH